MKLLRIVPAFVALAVGWSGCTTQNTAALRIGMTKEEAIKAMGEPNSVSAQGAFEYLNYMLSESSANGGYWTRPYYVRLAEGKVQAYGYSEQINRLMPPSGAFANAAAKSGTLRVGMTKAEALAAMGPPGSVSAQGAYEYLNYTSSEVSPSGFGTMTRPYYVRLLDGRVDAFGFTDQIGRTMLPSSISTTSSSSATHTIGSIAIVSVAPSSIVAGKTQEIAVKVKYAVPGGDHFRVAILANTAGANRFQQIAEQVVDDPRGEITVTAKVTPVDWGDGSQFRMLAHLFPYPLPSGQPFRPLAFSLPYAVSLAP